VTRHICIKSAPNLALFVEGSTSLLDVTDYLRVFFAALSTGALQTEGAPSRKFPGTARGKRSFALQLSAVLQINSKALCRSVDGRLASICGVAWCCFCGSSKLAAQRTWPPAPRCRFRHKRRVGLGPLWRIKGQASEPWPHALRPRKPPVPQPIRS
jgi:hypothetical protein